MLRKRLGQRIYALRMWRRLSQETLAEASDYSVDFISLVERGVNAPSIEGCERIAQALRIKLKDLFDFDSMVTPVTKRPRKKTGKRKKTAKAIAAKATVRKPKKRAKKSTA